jgi:hypothetical protein
MIPSAATPYEKRVAADMETVVLRLAKDMADLIAELQHLPANHRRQAVGRWIDRNPIVAAMVVDDLASFCVDLVELARKRSGVPESLPAEGA